MRTLTLCVLLECVAPRSAGAGTDATLLRLFLADGTALVSFGEFARLDDRVVFSMPVGGTDEQPRLHVVTIPANAVDWARTNRYVASARYQHYASTRGQEDFVRLSSEVARVLNEVAMTTEPHRALQIAEKARSTLADWPQAHYGYRQRDVREIVGLLDEAISDLRAAAGIGAFDLSFVALAADVPLEPVIGMPSPRDMIRQILAVADLADRPQERLAMLQSALTLLNEAGSAFVDHELLRASISARIRAELALDQKYARLSARWLPAAARAAAQARVRDVEGILARVRYEDQKYGGHRRDVIEALTASIQVHLDGARRLRLLRDQWMLRRALYREYERSIASSLLQLVKAQPSLDAIKRLDGPQPSTLTSLRGRLEGGAERLSRVRVPEELRGTHDLLVGAWQFAETAVRTRHQAIGAANMEAAWRASSAAAGAMMMLSRVQGEIRGFLEPPRLSSQ